MNLFKFREKFNLGAAGSFRNNALIMSSGALLNVIISLGLYPVVTRLYSKEQFGVLGLFLSVTGIMSLLGTCLYPSAFVIPKFKRTFYSLLKLTILLSLVFLILVIFLLFTFEDFLVKIFELESIKYLFPLIPLFVLLSFVRDISVNWNVRNRDFKKNALSNIFGSFSQKGSNILYALALPPSALGLIISSFVSLVVTISLLGIKKMKKNLPVIWRIDNGEVYDVFLTFKKYPLSILPGNLINRITSDLPIYLFTIYFSPAATGAYVLANTILNVPISVISGSVSSVYLQNANSLYHTDRKKFLSFTDSINVKLVIVGSICFGFLFSYADIIFPLIFGSEWAIAGRMGAILSLYLIFKLVSSPITRVFRIVKKEEYSLYVSIVLAISRIIGMTLGVLTNDLFDAVLLFSIANIIGYMVTYAFAFKAIEKPIFSSLLKSGSIVTAIFTAFYCTRYILNLTLLSIF